ncbi:MAG: T9SS type A sorting domain-containing protein [Saprospiraceae bacterium]|nr:T9SS type A sorting domain-containing protein [Saprospiraceae bacterium]
MKKCFYTLMLVCTLFTVRAQELVSSTFLQSIAVSELPAEFAFFARYGIDLYKVLYTTPDIEGRTDTASGLLILPQLEDDLAIPFIVVQHGTVDGPNDVPSNLRGGWELAGVFGAMGYAAISPDMLGLGESRGFHPYVHAATEASAAIDMMYAMQELDNMDDGFALNDQVFVTGYSQGGHAAQALHRELQANHADVFPVTAAAHLSGPYSISEAMFDLIIGDQPYGTVAYAPYTMMAYNEVYGLYDDLEEYVKQPYADMCKRFYRGEVGLFELNGQLIDTLIAREGASITRLFLQDSLIENATHNENHPLRVALRDNDTYDWTPQSPTRIFYCEGDDQVPFRNSIIADSVMRANGAPNFSSTNLSETANHGECVLPALTNTIFFMNALARPVTSTRQPYAAPVQYWPNPAQEQMFIQGLPEGGQLSILDLNGQLQKTWVTQSDVMRLNLAGLSSGMYILSMESAAGYWTQKVIKR